MPEFNSDKWNKRREIQQSHNCYAYALDVIDKDIVETCKKRLSKKKSKCRRPQPGIFSRTYNRENKLNCRTLEKRMISDNPSIKKINKNKKLKNGNWKIMLATTEGDDNYHYYREDSNHRWSHKNGWRKATKKDGRGRVIRDPEEAERGIFKKVCGYYEVDPREEMKVGIF